MLVYNFAAKTPLQSPPPSSSALPLTTQPQSQLATKRLDAIPEDEWLEVSPTAADGRSEESGPSGSDSDEGSERKPLITSSEHNTVTPARDNSSTQNKPKIRPSKARPWYEMLGVYASYKFPDGDSDIYLGDKESAIGIGAPLFCAMFCASLFCAFYVHITAVVGTLTSLTVALWFKDSIYDQMIDIEPSKVSKFHAQVKNLNTDTSRSEFIDMTIASNLTREPSHWRAKATTARQDAMCTGV